MARRAAFDPKFDAMSRRRQKAIESFNDQGRAEMLDGIEKIVAMFSRPPALPQATDTLQVPAPQQPPSMPMDINSLLRMLRSGQHQGGVPGIDGAPLQRTPEMYPSRLAPPILGVRG